MRVFKMRVFKKLAAIAMLGLAAAACGGGNDGINEPASIAGTYNLETIDGKTPPVVVFEEPGLKVEVVSGNFILTASGTFTTTVGWRTTENGQVTTNSETFPGTYTVTGTTVNFAYADGDTDSATLAGSTLTFTEAGSTVVFRK